jgi:hypothetical protein
MPLRVWSDVARYGLPGFFLGLALMWGTANGRGTAVQAQTPPPAERTRMPAMTGGEMSGTLAFTSQTAGMAQLLYLVDTRNHAFAVYRIEPTNPKGTVKLEAARRYQWDLKLAEYNNQPPEVAAIESTVQSLGRSAR